MATALCRQSMDLFTANIWWSPQTPSAYVTPDAEGNTKLPRYFMFTSFSLQPARLQPPFRAYPTPQETIGQRRSYGLNAVT